MQAPCGQEGSSCQTEADCCEGNPDVDLPPLYCARTQPLGRGTCKQVGAQERKGKACRMQATLWASLSNKLCWLVCMQWGSASAAQSLGAYPPALPLQCVPTKSHGCDTVDELSCCSPTGTQEVCTSNGKGGAVCLLP